MRIQKKLKVLPKKKDKIMKRIIFLIIFFSTKTVFSQYITPYLPEIKYIQLKDTIFKYEIYQTGDYIDSVICGDKITKLTNKKWIGQFYPSGSYFVYKFRRKKPSSWFKENNGTLFQADYELKNKAFQRFDSDGTIMKYWRCGIFSYTKEIKPKKDK